MEDGKFVERMRDTNPNELNRCSRFYNEPVLEIKGSLFTRRIVEFLTRRVF